MKKNIGVFCIILDNNQILLGKRNYGNYGWTLPGGSVENNESIVEALKREVIEETGQEIENIQYVLTSYSIKEYSIALIFIAKIKCKNEIIFSKNELTEVKWFDISRLPFELTERQKKWINNGLKKINNGDLEELIEL